MHLEVGITPITPTTRHSHHSDESSSTTAWDQSLDPGDVFGPMAARRRVRRRVRREFRLRFPTRTRRARSRADQRALRLRSRGRYPAGVTRSLPSIQLISDRSSLGRSGSSFTPNEHITWKGMGFFTPWFVKESGLPNAGPCHPLLL